MAVTPLLARVCRQTFKCLSGALSISGRCIHDGGPIYNLRRGIGPCLRMQTDLNVPELSKQGRARCVPVLAATSAGVLFCLRWARMSACFIFCRAYLLSRARIPGEFLWSVSSRLRNGSADVLSAQSILKKWPEKDWRQRDASMCFSFERT